MFTRFDYAVLSLFTSAEVAFPFLIEQRGLCAWEVMQDGCSKGRVTLEHGYYYAVRP
jgi:hypothetical protein